MLYWIISLSIVLFSALGNDEKTTAPNGSTCDAQISTLSSNFQKLEQQVKGLGNVHNKIEKGVEDVSIKFNQDQLQLEKSLKKLEEATTKLTTQITSLEKEIAQLKSELKTSQEKSTGIISQIRSKMETDTTPIKEIRHLIGELIQRVQTLETNSSILVQLQTTVQKGVKAGTEALHSWKHPSLEMFVDPSFYRALYDIFNERIEFLKYASVNKVLPALKYDFMQVNNFVRAKIKYIYSHEIVKSFKKIVTPYLAQLNLDKQIQEYIINVLIALMLITVIFVIYYIILAICDCFCPRGTNKTSTKTPAPAQPVKSAESTQPAGPTQPAEPIRSAESIQSVQPIQSVEPIQSAQPGQASNQQKKKRKHK